MDTFMRFHPKTYLGVGFELVSSADLDPGEETSVCNEYKFVWMV
jgi:hypothetical protein